MQTKRLDKNYAKGTPIRTVIKDLARQMGLPLGSAIDQLSELNQTLSKGFAVSGNPMKDLSRILSGKPIKLSVQNQSLQLRKKDEPLQKEAISLSAKTGLVGSPEFGANGEMVVRSLLMSELAPGRKVHIDSAVYNGFAVIEAVRFAGSNVGDDWTAEMNCKAC